MAHTPHPDRGAASTPNGSPRASGWETARVRRDFPILQQQLPKGQRVVFLDSGASAQKPQQVIDKEREVYERYYANAYRGVYRFGAQVDEELESSRSRIQRLVGAARAEEIIFTPGATAAINLVAFGWGRRVLRAGDEVLLSVMEHHANLVPWQVVAAQQGAVCRYLPLTADGRLDLSQLDRFLTPRTRIVAVCGMSNVLGTINPVRVLADAVHREGGYLLVDGAQSVPHGPTDVGALGADFLAFSGHKVYGPSGVGALYGRYDLLAEMEPLIYGGHMIDRVTEEGSTWAAPPARFEAGTLPIAQAIALGSAVEYVESLGLEAIAAHEHAVTQYAWDRLREIPGVRLVGPPVEARGGILSFTIAGAHAEDLAQLLDRKGVFVRHGHHCTMPLHSWLGVPATVRVSLGMYNDRDDIDALCEALQFARQRLRLS